MLEKARAEERHWKLTQQARPVAQRAAHASSALSARLTARAQGKTTEAQADLARLSLIKAQREEAAKKRAEELASKKAGPVPAKK